MRLWKEINSKIPSTQNDNNYEEDIDNILLDKHISDGAFDTNMSARRKGKHKHDRNELQAKAKDMSFSKRRRTRMLAAQLETPQSTLMCVLKEKGAAFRRHSNALKPKLTEENQQVRLRHALSKIDPNATTPARRGSPQPKFKTLFDEVHANEKSFYLCRDGENCIVIYGEEPQKQHVSHKSHITKVMFLCAQARPRRLHNGTWWDGKVGIWPVGEHKVAQRKSVNRPAGAEEFAKQSVDQDKHREMMINEVVPAMQSKFPACE